MVAVARQLTDFFAAEPVRPRAVESLTRADRIRGLALRWRDQRDTAARDALLDLHQPLIHAFAKRYPSRLGYEDLVQEAQLGFLRALDTYDPDRGVELSTYARHWIRAYVHRYLLRSWSVVARFTTHEKRRVFFGAGHARRALGLAGQEEEEGDEEKVASRLKVRPEVVREVESARGLHDEALEGSSDDGHERFASCLPGPDDAAIDNERARLLRERLPKALATLDERERMIFLSRFDPDEAVPLEELGARLGVTRERARQLETRARKKLAASFADLVDEETARQAMVAPPRRRCRARSNAAATA
ncbi:sigma-70 family RNA polymerase sigma factor [Vulgatibacter sp.]|uniref:sigma-70 family RNA polymerase sigma factor n=1 Tax=Vulgatibacter sp. TaxID=1971226 RepID=UPI0035626413